MKSLDRTFYKLYNHFGPQKWWPADNDIEMMIGAVLVQNTNWNNVSKALQNFNGNFRGEEILSFDYESLVSMIQSVGFYKRKAQTILNLMNWYNHYKFNNEELEEIDTLTLRNELLSIHGIGEETCDCLLLYTFNRPVFIVDAYLKRLLIKLGYPAMTSYAKIQAFMMKALPHNVQLFQEYHALIVEYGKFYLPRIPKFFEDDPLNSFSSIVEYSLKDLVEIPNKKDLNHMIIEYGFIERPAYPDPFLGSVYTIVGQLLSVKAARAIFLRLSDTFPTLESIQDSSIDEIKEVGLSRPKASYIYNLSLAIKNGSFDFNRIPDLSDEEAIEYLTCLKGFGVWSAKMVLIHSFNRLDISSYEDIGLRNGAKKYLGVSDLSQKDYDAFLDTFSPYKTIACLYLWKINHSSSNR